MEVFNGLIGIGTTILLVIVIGLWALVFLGETKSKWFQFFKRNAFVFGFVVALGGMIGSLIYSEVFHLAPCLFCWWARIFIYPQVAIFAVGMFKREVSTWGSSMILSVIGIGFSIYHVLIQAGIVGPSGACATVGVSCAKIDVLIFGWLTIPIMGLILLASLASFAILANQKNA